jgi:SAM-dependent methyltransferase
VGCGRGEILRHTAELGALAYGIDYAPVAARLSRQVADAARAAGGEVGVYQASALGLPFPDGRFERVLMLDIVEHLYPAELDVAMAEARRVLVPGGRIVIHTAPNVWYDRYAYPVVRAVRRLMGQGARYPKDPRGIIPANLQVHVNEQSLLSLRRLLRNHAFSDVRAWLSTPPQQRQENPLFGLARRVLFGVAPFRWFFERELFAVGQK